MKVHALALAALCTAVSFTTAAHEVIYSVQLSGAAEVPPNASPATGSATVTFDLDLVTMRIDASFADLLGTTTAAHIHCCTGVTNDGTAGVATQVPSFAGFPIGVRSGVFDQTYDLSKDSSYNPAFIAFHGSVGNAMNALLAGAAAGQAYLNLHTTDYPAGEIRGFLVPVPEPASYVLMALGLLAVGTARRLRR